MSPKRKQGDEDAEEAYTTMIPKSRRRVTVLEISDLEKEYMLVLARLQLLQQDTDPAHVTGNFFHGPKNVAIESGAAVSACNKIIAI